MNLSKLKLITFDVTDTLLKFRSAPGRQYGEIGALYGVLADNNALASSFKAHWHKMNKEHPNFGLKTGLGWENWWHMIIAGTFKDTNTHNMDDKKLQSISSHLIDVYKTSACWQQSYGALGLLSYLRSKRIPLGVISNFDPRLSATLENTKLRHYFKFVLTSYEVGVEKPQGEIFARAMEMAGIDGLKPEECLHVGDTAALDYFGARNYDWRAFLVHDRSSDKLVEKYPGLDVQHVYSSLYDMHKQFVDANEENLRSQVNK